ncbi:MAG: ATP-grasp domain-containing protein [Proteobacteria bacterium]|nr:ATP-grasp domain-containing protein [Pseudomonadota bacterium]NOG59236.1 ATP-grasp domain-containing protein [Pseudomonadota bacterium]
MRHFLFEFITGGGLSEEPLPDSLIGEGELMMQTLIKELNELNDSELSLCRDSRLALYETDVEQHVVASNVDAILVDLIKKSDVCWLIAPETGACLEKYARLFTEHGKLFIGSSADAIKLTTSKYLTNKVLSENGINVVETKWMHQTLPESNRGWVIKADDGAGAEDTCLIKDKNKLLKIIESNASENLIVQPYIEGKHMSMSLLVFDGDVSLLACNQQYIEIIDGYFKLKGIGVNECLSYKEEMLLLAKKIISTIPGLAGYIGVDLIEVDRELLVFEINPRFTTAYSGISDSIGCNITSEILDTFVHKKLPDISLGSAIPIRVDV